MGRFSSLACCVLVSCSGRAAGTTLTELGVDEFGETMAVSGDTLALGVGHRERYDPRKGVEATLESQVGIALLRERAPTIRTPMERGVLRRIVSTPSGFVALRVVISEGPGAKVLTDAHVFFVDLAGKVTELPPLAMDALGLWVAGDGDVFVHSSAAVMRWSPASPGWKDVPLDPAIARGPIRRIAVLDDGAIAVVNDDAVLGFTRLDAPPTFVRPLHTYPYPIALYGGGDRWWLVLEGDSGDRVVQVSRTGAVREVTTLTGVIVLDLLFSRDRVYVVCGGRGGDHERTLYVLHRQGKGLIGGPSRLPDDAMRTCLWKGRIVSTNSLSSRVRETSIPRDP